jgi:MFS transporter, MHS family, shikimate and dehydroshikimate transport protein
MDRRGEESGARHSSIRQVALAGFVGTTMEWYDFFLYGAATALIFNQLYFPSADPLLGTLAAFSTFAVGFIARPLGGIIFGHFGDRIGRRQNLIITLALMGLASAAIGLLPTFDTIGIWAPIILVVLRILQGFAVGGEWGGAVLMTVEHSPNDSRGYYASWVQMGVPAGIVLANGLYLLFQSSLPEEAFLAWGWRVPFLLSIVLVAVGLYIRLRIEESPAFAEIHESHTETQTPVMDVIRNQPKNVLVALGSRLGDNVIFTIFEVFTLTYITEQLGLPESLALAGVLIGAGIELFTIPLFGALTDRVGRRPVFMGGLIFCVLYIFPFFWLLNTAQPLLVVLSLVVALAVGHSAMYSPEASFFAELFDTRTRYSCASIGYQIAPIVGGGIAPAICTVLLAWSGSYWPIALYMIAMGLIGIISLYFAPETYKRDLYAEARTEAAEAKKSQPASSR